jgi:putative oxidoreductase
MNILINLGFTLRSIILVFTSRLQSLPPLFARISVGLVFAHTGWGKLHNLDKVIAFFRQLGIPSPELQAPFVATTEFVCGSLLIVGLFTRVAAIPVAITMVVALLTAIAPKIHGWTDLFGTEEFLFLLVFVWLTIQGPGPISLDKMVVGKRDRA